MGKGIADVTVHIDETIDHSKLQEISDAVRSLDGIESVTFHDDKPHFMIVKYDPEQTDLPSIHKAVVAEGVHAELLGL